MEVQIISQEYIKPSSPTPPHLNTYKFSLLDHLMPPVYVPMILFYPPVSPPISTSSERSQALKQSLSETLTRFYPLAGRIRSNLCIDCNDEGAYYIEAKVESHDLSEFLQHPDLSLFPKLVPPFNSLLDYTDQLTNPTTTPGGGPDVVMVQVTNFACGGFVIGVYVSHMIVDGVAISTFLQAWAAATAQNQSGDQCIHVLPSFDGATLFPPIHDEQGKFAHPTEATMRGLYRRFAKKGRCVNKRFVFEASAVAKLKELAATSSLQNPSRVEAVSAFIWKCARAAWKAKSGRSAPSLITHAVNLRRRADPNLPQNSMGNFVCLTGAIANECHGEEELELSSLVSKMREATSKVNGDLVAKLQDQGRLETLSKVFQDMADAIALSTTNGDDKVEMNFIGYTSIAYSGVYDADFGWGKPLWVAPVHEPCHEAFSVNVVRLMDTGEWGNNGFEAWISLAEEEMILLQSNQDLLAFASLNPSILLR
ncbi:PREDICTED: vinorine synthase-like [Fragaria vesca subsp. vesca]|uniref:vinorine synthase-like n=1 Tax=Fragaria vesca subsp. vesca TaxID=101020 RepID=UPI0002C3607A|nr:PREDICTED: vinorine synthase-like [Fragaria vesca subsp. vesca]